jgi:hypothetical protein
VTGVQTCALPIFFNFALEYAIRKVQEIQVGLKLNGTHQLLVYADDMNLLSDNIDATKKNMKTLIDASNEVGLEVNTEKTKYIVKCRWKAGILWPHIRLFPRQRSN